MRLWDTLRHLLFDDTLARENLRDVEAILRLMLSISHGDGDFDDVLRRAMEARQPGTSWGRAPRLATFIRLNTRLQDRNAPWAVVVEHVLEDLPRIFGIRSDPAGNPER